MGFDLGDALLAGSIGAMQTYGGQLQHQHDLDEAAAAAKAKEEYEERMKAFGVSIEPPKYNTYDDVQDGVRGKRTMRSHYDATSGKVVEDDLGFTPDAPKPPETRNVIQGENEATQQFNPQSGQWETIGQPGPRFNPREAAAGGADKVTFDDYNAMTPDQKAAYRAYKAPGAAGGESEADKADKAARIQTALALRDFNKMSRYEKLDALKTAGVDPGIADGDTKTPIPAAALEQYRNTLRDDNLTLMGASLFPKKITSGGVATTAPTAAPLLSSANTMGPPAPTAAPAAGGKAPYPDGTKVKGPDGRLYIVKNGQPVPLVGQ